MKIAVLGATGATGRLVVEQAIRNGHQVVAYVRRPDAVPVGRGITVVKGELNDAQAMRAAFVGVDAVISCLGVKLSLASMWHVDLMSQAMPTIIAAAKHTGVRKLVLMSAFGVGDTAAKASGLARLLYRSVVAAIYRDKKEAEAYLPDSGLNWTTVYPVVLQDAPRLEKVTVARVETMKHVAGLPKVPFANAAEVLIEMAVARDRAGQRLVVMP